MCDLAVRMRLFRVSLSLIVEYVVLWWQVDIERAEQLGVPSDVVCRLAVGNRRHTLSVHVSREVS